MQPDTELGFGEGCVYHPHWTSIAFLPGVQLEQYFGDYVPFCHTQVIVTDLGSPQDFDFTDFLSMVSRVQTLQTLP